LILQHHRIAGKRFDGKRGMIATYDGKISGRCILRITGSVQKYKQSK